MPDSDLFGSNGPYLPRVFPGETLYSWCARYHRLSGNPTARQTSRQLFGSPHAGLRHDFPDHLDRFQKNTAGTLGTSDDLIDNRTIFGLHKPFLDEKIISVAVHSMRTSSGRSVKVILGFAASQLGVAVPLKLCPACIQEDIEQHQTSWWHLEHQYPAVRVCRRHMHLLSVAKDKLHIPFVKDWLLPADLTAHDLVPLPTVKPSGFDRLIRIAAWNDAVVGQPATKFDRAILRHVYLMRTEDLGLKTMSGGLRFRALCDAFGEAHRGLEELPGLSFLMKTADVNGGFIGSLLRQYAGSRHPIKHILLMAFLFDAPGEFLRRYEEARTVAENEGMEGLASQLRSQQGKLLHLVRDQGKSVNAAAAELGATTTQAIRFLKKSGTKYKERPRVLSPDLEVSLRDLLRAGQGRDEIAADLSIRKAFIKDYLAKDQTLRETWEQARLQRQIVQYRERFLRMLADNPGIPVKQLRLIPKNGFQWLDRHDRAWLEEQMPSLWKRINH